MKFHNPNGDYVMLTNLSTKSKNRIPSFRRNFVLCFEMSTA